MLFVKLRAIYFIINQKNKVMEEQIQETQETTTSDKMLTQLSIENLRGTVPWMKFVSILGFITSGILIIVAFYGLITGSFYEEAGMTHFYFSISIIMAIFIGLPNVFLYKYATGLEKFYNSNDYTTLEKAIKTQKTYWTLMGIIVLISFISLLYFIV